MCAHSSSRSVFIATNIQTHLNFTTTLLLNTYTAPKLFTYTRHFFLPSGLQRFAHTDEYGRKELRHSVLGKLHMMKPTHATRNAHVNAFVHVDEGIAAESVVKDE